jgi:4-amino-4-deoxy-L-arabinose transferase-like glycosyltransferase
MALIGSAIFFLISIFFFSFLAWDYPLLSPDEPRYAETAREMLASGNFIIPYLDGIPRLVKPVLFYWLDALSLKVFGLNEFAARFPSIVAASGLVSLAFLFGALNRIGILTAIITMTSLGIFIASKLAITDMLLNFFITAALVFFYLGFDQTNYKKMGEGYHDHKFSVWVILSIVMMGLGFLTKGPIAFVIPLSIISIFLFFKADILIFLRTFIMEIGLGIFLAFIINIPWYCLVHIATNGEFTSQFFFDDNLNRFIKPHTGHSAPFWFYIPVIIAGLFPWSFFLVQSIFAQDFSSGLNLKSEKSRQEKAAFFCAIWAIVIFIIFTISKTKLPTYILPIFLPLCFFIARWWDQRFSITKSQNSKNLGLFWGLISFASTLVIAFLVYIFKFKEELKIVEPNAFLLVTILICSIFLACTAIALTSVFSNAKISFVFFTGANVVCLLLFTAMVLKPFAIHRDGGSKAFSQALKPETPFKTLLEHPTRFSFYRQKITSKLKPKEIKDYFKNNANAQLVLRTKDFTKLEKRSKIDLLEYKSLENNRIYTFVEKI